MKRDIKFSKLLNKKKVSKGFSVGEKFLSKSKVSQWEKSSPMVENFFNGKKLSQQIISSSKFLDGKKISQWEKSFSVRGKFFNRRKVFKSFSTKENF